MDKVSDKFELVEIFMDSGNFPEARKLLYELKKELSNEERWQLLSKVYLLLEQLPLEPKPIPQIELWFVCLLFRLAMDTLQGDLACFSYLSKLQKALGDENE